MNWTPAHLPFGQTGYFSTIIMDYLSRAETLKPFYAQAPTPEGLDATLAARQQLPIDRPVLVQALRNQYQAVGTAEPVRRNIDSLLDPATFTVCTAHQPAIFTGTLYFVYKILHTIRLAERLTADHPGLRFVPVFYMGSEDADLDELGNIHLNGEKLVWDTKQKGAVGRMQTKGLEKILNRIEGELSVQPYGRELMTMLREIYLGSPDIQTATFRLIHRLFAQYGLVVLIPDNADLKRLMIPVFEDDLFNNTPSAIVNKTIGELSRHYKVQANPRAINLFYLKDDLRNRIERKGDRFLVHDTDISFDESSIKAELREHPERFSPNVILRGLLQETVLPNVAFIGGGGETAYWLELRTLFAHYKVSYPVLVLRNSFLLIDQAWSAKLQGIGLGIAELFKPGEQLVDELVKKESGHRLSLEQELTEADRYYQKLGAMAAAVDATLAQHVEALHAKAVSPLKELEKKLLKAEKRKFVDQQRHIHAVRNALFPSNNLQERIDNFMPWYAARGKSFIDALYEHSPALDEKFIVLREE